MAKKRKKKRSAPRRKKSTKKRHRSMSSHRPTARRKKRRKTHKTRSRRMGAAPRKTTMKRKLVQSGGALIGGAVSSGVDQLLPIPNAFVRAAINATLGLGLTLTGNDFFGGMGLGMIGGAANNATTKATPLVMAKFGMTGKGRRKMGNRNLAFREAVVKSLSGLPGQGEVITGLPGQGEVITGYDSAMAGEY